jgi:hypothetical protein
MVTVDRLNRESRLTFALASDLTTFIHVCDVVRYDVRGSTPRVSLIELKSGQVNELLLDSLKDLEPTLESLQKLRTDPRIDDKHRKQALRMMRQEIRMTEVAKIMSTDRGVDPQLGMEIRLLGPEIALEEYDQFLKELCDEGREIGFSAGTVQDCLHLAVGFAEDHEEAVRRASKALAFTVGAAWRGAVGVKLQAAQEVSRLLEAHQAIKLIDLFGNNLRSLGTRPFTLWWIGLEHMKSLVSGQLVILACFDLAAFLCLGRTLGFDVRLSSRSDGEEMAKEFGGHHTFRWGGRCIVINEGKAEATLAAGSLSRVFADLAVPSSLFQMARVWSANLQSEEGH